MKRFAILFAVCAMGLFAGQEAMAQHRHHGRHGHRYHGHHGHRHYGHHHGRSRSSFAFSVGGPYSSFSYGRGFYGRPWGGWGWGVPVAPVAPVYPGWGWGGYGRGCGGGGVFIGW